MSNLVTRTITGIIFVIVMAGAVIWSPIATGILLLVFATAGYHEFSRLSGNYSFKKYLSGYITGIISYVIIFLAGRGLVDPRIILLILPLIAIPFFISISLAGNDRSGRFYPFFGVVYIFLPFALLNLLNNPQMEKGHFEPYILLGFIILVWVNDIFAYLVGRAAGRHKLFERISPKKTWEGAIGGLVFAVLAAYLAGEWVELPGNANWIVIAVLVVIFGITGDLFESWLKRRVGVKDSGTILPGHGGVLDRFDAMLFSGPVVFFYVLLALQ